MKTKRILILALIAALALSGCAMGARATQPAETGAGGGFDESFGGPAGEAPLPAATMAPAAPPFEGDAVKTALEPAQANRLVIRNATLSMEVANPAEANNRIASLATSLGGFVVTSYVYQASVDAAGNSVMQANITIRVPAEQLDAALAQIRALAVEVKTENISGQDVTAEYTDLESRLRNLEAAEAQLQKIMDEATKTEDVLAVFNQLTYIREQIEQIEGQLKYYRDSAALSAISVELIADVLSQPLEVGGWRPQGVAKEALEALLRALQGLATAVIWIVIYLVPLGLLIGLPLYGGARLIVRRLRRPRATAAS